MMAPDAGMFPPSTSHVLPSKAVDGKEKRTIANPKDKVNNGYRYIYVANGNLVYINTSRVKRDLFELCRA